jgi:hypothetical protein
MTSSRVLIVLELLIGAFAIAGGVALLSGPTGGALGFDVAMMRGAFGSFTIPAIALLLMGAMLGAAAFMTVRRERWATVASALAGATLLLWIAVQWMIIGFNSWTQPVFFLVGALIFFLSSEQWRDGAGPHVAGSTRRRTVFGHR